MSNDMHSNRRRGMHRRVVAKAAAPTNIIQEPTIMGPTGPIKPTSAPTSSSQPTTSAPPSSATSSDTSLSSPSSSSSATPAAGAVASSSSSSSPSPSASSSASSSDFSSSSASSASSSSSSTPLASKSSATAGTPTHAATTSLATGTPITSGGIVYTTQSLPLSLASAASAPTASVSTTPSSGVNSGAIVGGVIAGIIGLAGILFAIYYFIRRGKRSDDEPIEDFNAMAFRRQSVMLPEDEVSCAPSLHHKTNTGFNLPPPSMMNEQMMAHAPPSLAGRGAYYNAYAAQPPFASGQYVPMGAAQGFPPTPTSANPFLDRFGQPPMSAAPYSPAYPVQGQSVSRQPSNGAAQYLSRQPSYAGMPNDVPNDSHYVDLERSSVTPFQAAQYAEISRRLNTDHPGPLTSPTAAAIDDEASKHANELPPVLEKEIPASPITDKALPPASPMGASPFSDPSLHQQAVGEHADADELSSRDSLLMPLPAFSSHSRIASIPPMLPEIQIAQRPFSPVTATPMSPGAPAPSVPSPLSAATFPAPPPLAHIPDAAAIPRPRPTEAGGELPDRSKRETTYTVYEEEDAYGGM